MTSLLDLPPDALLHLSTLLSSHHDLVALGSSCRVLRECVNQVRSPPHTCQLHRHPPPPPATATSGATSTAFLPAPLLACNHAGLGVAHAVPGLAAGAVVGL